MKTNNYADDATPYSSANEICTANSEFSVTSTRLLNWFDNNHMRANPGKYNLLLKFKTPQVVSISGKTITFSTAEALLGVAIDLGRNFENHINSMSKKVGRKINVFSRIINNYMPLGKHAVLVKIFTESWFN